MTGPAAEAVGGYDTAAETAGTMGTRPVEPGETDRTGGLRVDTGAGPRPAAGPQGPGEDVDEGGEKVGRDEVLTEGGDWDVERTEGVRARESPGPHVGSDVSSPRDYTSGDFDHSEHRPRP